MEAQRDRLPIAMPAVLYHLAAVRPHAIHQRAACAENPAIEDGIAGAAGQRDALCIETDDIGEAAFRQPEPGHAESLRSAAQRPVEQGTAGRNRAAGGQYVARPERE